MLAKRYATWYTASITNYGREPCGDPKPFGHAIRRYTNEIYLERPKSIILTRVVVAGAIAGCGIMTVSGPWLTRWMVSAHALPPASGPVLLGMGYVCAVLAFVMLVSLYKFLRRIEAGAVFVPANVTALRRISWCCAGAAVVCLAAAYIYLPFAFLGVAAAFMALIVRVLKNAFAQAVHMKDELDYTI